jgi:hypothetical protein
VTRWEAPELTSGERHLQPKTTRVRLRVTRWEAPEFAGGLGGR